jgi:hypothetical protein
LGGDISTSSLLSIHMEKLTAVDPLKAALLQQMVTALHEVLARTQVVPALPTPLTGLAGEQQ